MNRTVIVAIVILLALLAGGYLWYQNEQRVVLPPQVASRDAEPAPPTATEIEVGIDGDWRSVEDANFIRSFSASGSVTDRYSTDPGATASGRYELDGDRIPAEVREMADGRPVLMLEFPEERIFFAVTKLTETELELADAWSRSARKYSSGRSS